MRRQKEGDRNEKGRGWDGKEEEGREKGRRER